MLRNLWLTFAQAITVGLAALFVTATLRPEWLPSAWPGRRLRRCRAPSAARDSAGAPFRFVQRGSATRDAGRREHLHDQGDRAFRATTRC